MSKKIRVSKAAKRLREEAIYKYVLDEISTGVRRDGLWAKAMADANGNEGVAKSNYIKLRVQSILDDATILKTGIDDGDTPEESDNRRVERATITLMNQGYEVIYNRDQEKWRLWKKGSRFGLVRKVKNLRELERIAKKYSGR